MKTDTVLVVGALAVAAGLVLMPRRSSAAVSRAGQSPNVGGSAGTVWDDAATARYREQLARQVGNDWTGP